MQRFWRLLSVRVFETFGRMTLRRPSLESYLPSWKVTWNSTHQGKDENSRWVQFAREQRLWRQAVRLHGQLERRVERQDQRQAARGSPRGAERQRAPACYWSQPAAQYCLGAKSIRQSRNTNKHTKIFIFCIDGDNKDL